MTGPTRIVFRDQRGESMIEFLIALLILSLTVGGVAAATMSAGVTGDSANKTARVDVLSTAFGEAIKSIPYRVCADALYYQDLFDKSEGSLPGEVQKLIKDASDATLVIEDVSEDADCPGTDSGVQTVRISVQVGNRSRVRNIVKRTTEPELEPFNLDFTVEDRSAKDDPLVVWELKPSGSTDVVWYEWWCEGWPKDNPPDPLPEPSFSSSLPINPGKDCRYPAPADEGVMQKITVRATEAGTNRTEVMDKDFPLPITLVPNIPPLAQISVTSSPDCLAATPCAYNTPVTFQSSGPPPVGSSIISWKWNFGEENSQDIFCTTSGADPTGELTCVNQIHSFAGGGTFSVTLELTDSYGNKSNVAMRNAKVTGPVIVRPIVAGPDSPESAVTATPSTGTSPQLVSFDASGSHADGKAPGEGTPPGGIKNYYWNFGVEVGGATATQSGANLSKPTFVFPASSSREEYTVTVTVTDTNDITNSSTVTVVLDPLQAPINLRNSGKHKGDLPFLRNAYFEFQFVNVPRSPGDTISYKIKITAAGGFCGFFGVGNTRTFDFAGGPAGKVQPARVQFSSKPKGFNGVCATDNFTYSGQTVRENAGVISYSAWSSPLPLNPDFF